MTNNTRRFPRTTREAFRDADYACAIERPARAVPWQRMAIAAALLAGLSTCSYAKCSSGTDTYRGEDKALHLAAGSVISFATTLGTKSPLIGFAAGSAIGLLKEASDSDGSGTCSSKDLAVTVLGAAIGAFAGHRVLIWQENKTTVVAYRTEF